LSQYKTKEAHAFIFELAWREYFQRMWWQMGDVIHSDIRAEQVGVSHRDMQRALIEACTGITAIDRGICELYDTGYVHNHLRMYTASIACNIGGAHWAMPSQWMYYHLLDHDIASNTLSWQWVAGTFSSKKYYANQENINKYCGTDDAGTFLDLPYEKIADGPVPGELRETHTLQLSTELPATELPDLDPGLPLLLYNSYNLNPLWMSDSKANRVLILEPSHFKRFPISQKVLSFILRLAENIPGIQIYSGEVESLIGLRQESATYSQAHPAFLHYPGVKTDPAWLFPDIIPAKGSFMSFWKQCEKCL
jgi:deoxyribodipyrimidine photo-lyase